LIIRIHVIIILKTYRKHSVQQIELSISF